MPVGGILTKWLTGTNGAPDTVTNDLTDEVKSINMSINGEKLDDTTFATNFRTYLGSYVNGAFTVKYRHSPALALELLTQILNRQAVGFEYGPNGDDTGELKITGDILIEGFANPVSVNTVEDIDVTYSITGEWTPELYS